MLYWETPYDSITHIQPLLSPKLASFHLRVIPETSDNKAITSFLKTLPSRCPGLKVISFDIEVEEAGSIMSALSRAVCNFQKLDRLVIRHPIDGGALRHLFLSPQFTQLVFTNQEWNLGELLIFPFDIPFSSVKEITLSGPDLAYITGLLRSEHQTFSTAEFFLGVTPTSQLIHYFLTALVSQPRQSSLTSLTLKSHTQSRQEDDVDYSLLHNTLQPLTLLHNLRELRIDLDNRISLNDTELAGLAHGWPLLQVLKLDFMDASSTKRVTLRGLLLLSVTCPKLREVSLSVDCRKIPIKGVSTGVCSVSLEETTFRKSPIEDSYLVAAFLLTHFPSITSVKLWDQADANVKRWAQVQRYVDRKNDISLALRVKSS